MTEQTNGAHRFLDPAGVTMNFERSHNRPYFMGAGGEDAYLVTFAKASGETVEVIVLVDNRHRPGSLERVLMDLSFELSEFGEVESYDQWIAQLAAHDPISHDECLARDIVAGKTYQDRQWEAIEKEYIAQRYAYLAELREKLKGFFPAETYDLLVHFFSRFVMNDWRPWPERKTERS